MNLEKLYGKVAETIEKLDFQKIWPGFLPLKFALYNDKECFFNGHYIEKTDAFCANTSIVYEGESIAIWNVMEELEIPVLASKMVHEMFHGFQFRQEWTCWPNEMEALYRYEYDADHLSLKLYENRLLLDLLDHFDDETYQELLSYRKLRSEKHPYEFSYESKVEEIEGTANYVEWQVLKQLDEQKAARFLDQMREVMMKPDHLFPIRISCYYTGALMIRALAQAGQYSFETKERPAIMPILQDVLPSDGSFPDQEDYRQRIADTIDAFNEESRSIVETALKKNEIVLNGPYDLLGLNIYNARHYKEYLITTYFLMYLDEGNNKMLPGDFVIRMADEKTILCVYRWR